MTGSFRLQVDISSKQCSYLPQLIRQKPAQLRVTPRDSFSRPLLLTSLFLSLPHITTDNTNMQSSLIPLHYDDKMPPKMLQFTCLHPWQQSQASLPSFILFLVTIILEANPVPSPWHARTTRHQGRHPTTSASLEIWRLDLQRQFARHHPRVPAAAHVYTRTSYTMISIDSTSHNNTTRASSDKIHDNCCDICPQARHYDHHHCRSALRALQWLGETFGLTQGGRQ